MVKARISIFGVSLLCWAAVHYVETYPGGQCNDPRQREGICRPFKDCPIVQEELARNVTPSLCGISSGDYHLASTFVIKYSSYPDIEVTNVLIHKNALAHPIVCCPYQPMVTPPTSSIPPDPPTPPSTTPQPTPEIPDQTETEIDPWTTSSTPITTPPTPDTTSDFPTTEYSTTEIVTPEMSTEDISNATMLSSTYPDLSISELSELRKPGGRANYWCKREKRSCPVPVFTGTPVLRNDEFPHMAAVGYGEIDDLNWGCGGSLISRKFVLTAAHCLHSDIFGPAKWVLLGRTMLPTSPSFNENDGEIRGIVGRIPHEEYRPREKYHDIGLIQVGPAIMENPSSLSYYRPVQRPACLRTRWSGKQPTYIATGWGRVNFSGPTSMDLLKVELKIIDQSKCSRAYADEIGPDQPLSRGIDPTLFCTTNVEGVGAACEGDSGGPLQELRVPYCLHEILGIVSFGMFCSYSGSPSVFVNVTEYIDWIENHVWPL